MVADQDQEQVREGTKLRVGKQLIQIQEKCELNMLGYMDIYLLLDTIYASDRK